MPDFSNVINAGKCLLLPGWTQGFFVIMGCVGIVLFFTTLIVFVTRFKNKTQVNVAFFLSLALITTSLIMLESITACL